MNMDIVKYILVLSVLFVNSNAGGHEENHHDHVKLHVPEFIQHDHHTKVITIHHHHHKPKKEHHHHHHHHHHHPKPHIPHGPPKYHYSHQHSKSSSHSVSKGHTHLGQKSLEKHHGHHGKHGHSGNGHHSHKHDASATYDPPSTIHDQTPTVNYAPPSINYNHDPSFESNYGAFLPSVPKIPSPQIHGVVHTVQQVKVFDTLPQGFKTGETGYEVTEQGEEGEEDVFTSVNSLSQAYPGVYGHESNAANQIQFTDIAHLSTNQSPNSDPFAGALPQPNYSNIDEFAIQSQPTQTMPNVQPSYTELTGYNNADNSLIGLGNGVSDDSVLSFADAAQDDTPVSFSREAGLQQAINSGGIETIAY